MGRLAARRFAEANAKLIIVDINAAAIDKTADEIQPYTGDVLVLCCDVTQESSVHACITRAYQEFGTIDVAMNNAGMLQNPGRLAGIAADEFERRMDINTGGVFWCMKQGNNGVILNRPSAAGVIGTP